ncbi:MAG: DUF4388 domain-containing protein [Nitrospiraceae bacterium]|nr:DUF4388 domain-containing protein [Nitrospiraceae bacterium]
MAARHILFGDLLQELHRNKKTGALYVSIAEKSEDMARFYFKNGEIYHLRYGSAIGNDCLEILEYYTLAGASFYEGFGAPDKPAENLPGTADIISRLGKNRQMVKAGTV